MQTLEQLPPSKFEDEEARGAPVGEIKASSGQPTARPRPEFLLGALRAGLRVDKPFHVAMSSEAGQVVLQATEIDEFGFGGNLSDATSDLQQSITELYLTLREDRKRLGPDLRRVWEILEQKIREGTRV